VRSSAYSFATGFIFALSKEVTSAITTLMDGALKVRNAPDVFIYQVSAFGPDGKRNSSFTIEVGNNGTKGISAIDWEYDSPEAVAGYGDHLKIRSGELKIRPEERKKLTKEVHHYTARFVSSFNLSTVRIVRDEYDDGSTWQRPADDK
jgi:hypothetical protein